MAKADFRLLIVDDSPSVRTLLSELLEDYDLDQVHVHASTAASLGEALAQLERQSFDCCLLDLYLPDSEGCDTVQAVHKAAPDLVIIVYSGDDDIDMALDCIRAGAESFLLKGSVDYLTVGRALLIVTERHRVWRERLRQADAGRATAGG